MTTKCWVLAADERGGRLLRVKGTPTGHLHVTLRDDIQTAEEEHEHGRPSPRSGKDGHTYASAGHEEETFRSRSAKRLVEWLEQQVDDLEDERIAVFATPRFLGALRDAWSPHLASLIDEHHGDLRHLTPGELTHHRSIIDLMTVGQS